MSRFVLFSVVALLSACGAAGRCTSNNECPVGSACDAMYGVCVMPGVADAGASNHSSQAISSKYAHRCYASADCGDVPGSTCRFGMCVSDCSAGKACASGSTCLTYEGNSTCMKDCSASACGADLQCNPFGAGESYGLEENARLCVSTHATENNLSRVGGNCRDDGDCEGSLRCVTRSSGVSFCTALCTSTASACTTGLCVVAGSTGEALCYERCFEPGKQSSCREGFSCRAISGQTYGACM